MTGRVFRGSPSFADCAKHGHLRCQAPFGSGGTQTPEFRTQIGGRQVHRIGLEYSILVLEHRKWKCERCVGSEKDANGCFAPLRLCGRSYMAGGTPMPIMASTRVSSRRTTEAVAKRNFWRLSSGSPMMRWRW